VFDGRWLEPASFVSLIVNSDKVLRRRDLDDESFRRAATIVVSTREQIKNDEPIWLTEGLASGAVTLRPHLGNHRAGVRQDAAPQ
jgi:ornithine cyclodeaminase/alanine dehydrogenase-like protein (mu-crystallin family)